MPPYKAPYPNDRCINSLTSEELTYVRNWARGRLEKILNIEDIQLPRADDDYSFMWPTSLQSAATQMRMADGVASLYANEPRVTVRNIEIPARLHNAVVALLSQLHSHGLYQLDSEYDMERSFGDVLTPVLAIFDNISGIFPSETHQIWQTIITLNKNDDTATAMPSAKVKYPTPKHEELIRDAMVILPVINRYMAEYLLSFASHFCSLVATRYQALAKQAISTVLGPIFFKRDNLDGRKSLGTLTPEHTPGRHDITKRPCRWAGELFELLLYVSDRRNVKKDPLHEDCQIWRIPEDLVEELARNNTRPCTPRRSSLSSSRSRLSQRRTSTVNLLSSEAKPRLARRLFERPNGLPSNQSRGMHIANVT
ncbi:hypothetical protein HDU85_005182 [Gaertneriomyces sp. JEL0708]|nr:hypothetical protein HDU85_005182 [Gaertneriomyces sp. JEL0708]